MLSLLMAACQGEQLPDIDSAEDKADQISGEDDPSGLLSNAKRRLSDLVGAADIGQRYSVPDDEVPYPDTYWASVTDGIDGVWLEKSGEKCEDRCSNPDLSPLQKFVAITDPEQTNEARRWERENHGSEKPNVDEWWGHCPGWTAAAMTTKPLQHGVYARSSGARGVEACQKGSDGCARFEIGDINALQAEIQIGGSYSMIGSNCDLEEGNIGTDEFGRILGPGCKGLNAGSMLIVLANRIKMQRKSFAVDIQSRSTSSQIWNQPAYAYQINRFEALTEKQAANLVAFGKRQGSLSEYQFNKKAKGFALVDWSLDWVNEFGPNIEVVKGTESTETTRMVTVIELDADASDPKAQVIGGEYIEDGTADTSRFDVAPYAWIALGPGSDLLDHNPYVTSAEVMQLVAMARDETPIPVPSPPGTCAHDFCEQGVPLVASCDSCAASVCDEEPSCCTVAWSFACIGLAEDNCDAFCF